jgi:hypothetical protein
MAEFETGPAFESDEVTCGCNSRGVRGPISAESLFVPEQSTFPAAFLAEVRTTLTNAPYLQYLIIARQSESSPWKIVSDPGDAEMRPLDRPSGTHGFDQSSESHDSAKALPGDLAAYWHSWTEQDRAPSESRFAPGKWTSKAGATYGKNPSGSWTAINGLVGYYSFKSGGNDETWSFPTATGAITCGVVRWQTIWTYPGSGIYQDPGQTNWGKSVLPGAYRFEAENRDHATMLHRTNGCPRCCDVRTWRPRY